MGKDQELIQAVKLEDVATVMRIVGKVKLKPKRSGSSKKSTLNFQDPDGFSALHHAALNGNCHILSLLLNTGQVNPDIKDNKGMRPLHYAAWQGKTEPVELLLRAGANPSEPSLGGDTPLHLSSQYGSYGVVEALLQYQADPSLEQREGKTPLDFAAEFGRLKVAELLLGSCQALIHLGGHVRTGQKLHTPLHLAAKNGHSDVASVLLDHGIDINVETHNGTALHEAALAGKSEVVGLLINSGIDVLKKDSQGQTALDIVTKFTSNRAAADIKTLLRDAIGGSQARAIKDFMRLHDRAALSFKAGDIINVIERNPDGRWKGSLKKGDNECIGYFPRDHVQLIRGSPSTSESNNYPGSPPFSQSGFPIMPANTYQSVAPASPLTDTTKRYSTGSTASASSSGNWSNRGSTGPTVTSGMRPNHLPVGGIPDPPSSLPPAPPAGYYNGNGNEDFPPPPPELLHNNHSPQGTIRYHNDIRGSPNHTYTHHNHYPSNASPKKMNYPCPPWLAGAKFSDESGVEMSSSNENVERKYLKGTATLPLFKRSSPVDYVVLTGRPLKLSAAKSIENMTRSRDAMNALGPRRPHSDSLSESGNRTLPKTPPPQSYPFSKGKDADRIYDWLRQQRLVEYTNNFTLAGYDMPTIAKMTPEDLRAIGVKKAAHRKRITEMISHLNEQDSLPKYIPGDVATWLRLLNLSQYYNTLISNDYDTMDKAVQITWEDLQEIGINRLGDAKKFTLAIKRLNYLKKHGGSKVKSPSYPASLNSDSGSPSPAASLEGANQMYPPPAQFALSNRQPSPQPSPQQDESRLMVKPRSGALRNSRESLSSDVSVDSAGSHGSHDQLRQQDPNMRAPPTTRQTINEGIESTYVPAMSSFRVPGQGAKKSASLHSLDDVDRGRSFSTFKQPQISPEEASRRHQIRSTESLDKLMAAQAMADRFKRNSFEGGSSIASSGSGSGDQPAVKLKKALPPAPPKRTNSVSMHSRDYEPKTATIGRKKSMKKFREEMQLYRAEMEAEFAAGDFDHRQASRIEGYATIKRTSKKIDPSVRLQRSQSQEGDLFRGVPLAPVVPPTFSGQAQQNSISRASNVQPSNQGSVTRGDTDQGYSGHLGVHPMTQVPIPAFQASSSHSRPALNLENPTIHYQDPSSHSQQKSTHAQQNGGVVNSDSRHGGRADAVYDIPLVSRTKTTQSAERPIYHNSHTAAPSKPARSGVPLELHQPMNGSKFVCPPDNKSALAGAQVPVIQNSRNRKNSHSQDHATGQSRKASISEHSVASNESSGSSGRRPSSLEMPWKNQAVIEDDAAPVIQPALVNPLENIWRPKSRHMVRKGSMDKTESVSSGSGKSDSGSDPGAHIRTDATFLQLKKQFLEQDSEAPPGGYSTLKRNGRKPEPLSGNFREFSDRDEYNQSPVATHPPVEIPDVRAVPTMMSTDFAGPARTNSPDLGQASLNFPQPPPPIKTPATVFDKPSSYETSKSTPTTPRSRREDLQSRVEKIAAGRRDPSPTKGLSSYGNTPLHLHIADIPPAPDFAAPFPDQPSPTGSAASPPLPPPPPPLQSAMGSPLPPPPFQSAMGSPLPPPPPLQSAMGSPLPPPPPLQSVMGSPLPPPPLQSAVGGPPPPPPPPPPTGLSLPRRSMVHNSANNNNNGSGILKPAGSSRPPVKLMPDMSDLQRELQKRTSKQQVGSGSVEETIRRNQEAKAKEVSSPEIVTPVLRKLSKPSMTSKPQAGSGSLEGTSMQNQGGQMNQQTKGVSQSPVGETVPPTLKKLSKPPATKKKPVAPPPTKPRSPVAARELPRDDEKDVDIFSQDLDQMEMGDDVVESDGSDMESGVSGFEKENTDTIKKQPSKTSPPRPTLTLSGGSNLSATTAAPVTKQKVESPGVSWEDNDDDGTSTIKRRPKEARKGDEEEKRDSLGEAMEKLQALLNSPDGELAMREFTSPTSTPEKKKVEKKVSPEPEPVAPVEEDKAESEENMSAEEENKVFSDLESMFENLALDLENMLM